MQEGKLLVVVFGKDFQEDVPPKFTVVIGAVVPFHQVKIFGKIPVGTAELVLVIHAPGQIFCFSGVNQGFSIASGLAVYIPDIIDDFNLGTVIFLRLVSF
ncbi:hypothetical protein D3C85_1451980 [compost metagenome]